MARFVKNAVEGKPVAGRSGWRARRENARLQRAQKQEDRAAIAAVRAAHYARTRDGEADFNAAAKAGGDYLSQMTDPDLWAHYEALAGQPASPRAKRSTVEAAIRRMEKG